MTVMRPTSDTLENMSKVYNLKTFEGLFLNLEVTKAQIKFRIHHVPFHFKMFPVELNLVQNLKIK